MNLLETVFEWVVSTTLRASLVAVAILAIQIMLRPWMPAKWRHPLWLPLLVVMVLPFVPELPVHVIPPRHAEVTKAAPVIVEAIGTTTAVHENVASATAPPAQPGSGLLPLLWLSGVLITITAGITGYRIKLLAIRHRAVPPDASLQTEIEHARKAAGLSRTPLVWLSREVESPAVSGLLRPVLLLPAEFSQTFTATETRLILLHEFSHIKRHDLAQNWLLFVLQALHWFNPVIWFAFARLRMDRETACDARVLALEPQDRRSDYGHALLKMQDLPAITGLRLGFLGIFESTSGLRARITDISRHRRSHPAWHVTGCLLVSLIAVLGCTRAKEKGRGASATGQASGEQPAAGKEKTPALSPAQAAIARKLDTIVVPLIQIEDCSIEDVIDFVRARSKEYDSEEKDPARKGLNFVIRKARGTNDQKAWEPGRLTFQFKNASLRRILEEVAEQSGTQFKIDDFAVTFLPKETADLPANPPTNLPQPLKGKAAAAAAAIIIPVVDVSDATLSEIVDFLNQRAKQLGGENAPQIKLGPATKGDTRINELRLRNVPLTEAARYVAEAARTTLGADDTGIQIGN